MRNNAVLYEQEGLCYLLGKDSRSIAVHTPNSIQDFITIFEQSHADVIWVMPGLDLNVTWELLENHDRTRYNVFPERPMQGTRKKSPSYIRLRRQRGIAGIYEKEYYLGIPANEDWLDSGKTWACPTPQDLLTTVSYIEEEYPNFGWSPQNIGKNLFKDICEEKKWEIVDSIDTDLLKKVFAHGTQRPTWVIDGGLSKEQRRMKWLIGADKNGQYVGGCRSLQLGNGQYTVVGPDRFDEKIPGLWYTQVTNIRETIFNSFKMFCPWTSARQWLSTDLLIAARKMGIQYEILDGILWESHGQYMNTWGKEVWQHRAAYYDEDRFPNEVARRNAAGTSKQAGNSFIGLIASPQKVPGKGMLYRRDWNELIIQKSIANLMYSLNSRYEKHGMLPVLLARGDTQWYVTNDPDNIPGLFDHVREQRGWKPIGHPVPMSKEIIKLFQEQEGKGVQANMQKASRIAEYLEQKARS